MYRRLLYTFLTLIVVLTSAFLFLRGQEAPKVNDYPTPVRELMDLSKHGPYDYEGIGVKWERAVLAIRALGDSPKDIEKLEMLIQAVLRGEVDKGWFSLIIGYPSVNEVQLLDSKDVNVRQFVEKRIVETLLTLDEPPTYEVLRGAWTRYFRRLRQEGKEEPPHVAALLFQKNPAFALQLFWSLSDEFAQLPQEQKNQHTQELEWLLHCVDVAYYRARYLNMLDREDINPVRAQMKWLLWNYPQWWAKLYVVEVFIRIPGLANDELVGEIRKEKHPCVVIRLPELEKKLRRAP